MSLLIKVTCKKRKQLIFNETLLRRECYWIEYFSFHSRDPKNSLSEKKTDRKVVEKKKSGEKKKKSDGKLRKNEIYGK